MNVIIYDWGTRPDFLLRRLYPAARVVPATPSAALDWSAQEIGSAGPARNLWFFHLNVSLSTHWVPRREQAIAAMTASGWRVVNGRIVDTRKSWVQRTNRALGLADVAVTRDDDPSMKVMVKTDYNYGGICESRLSAGEVRRLGLLPVDGCPIRSFDQYYVCLLGEVSEGVWSDPRLVVERYIENDEDLLCRFYRCGSRAVLSEVANREVIKKMVPGLPRRNWCFAFGEGGPAGRAALVASATTMCRASGLEFGTLDIVLDRQERPVIVDVNPTPGWGAERQDEVTEFLAGGF